MNTLEISLDKLRIATYLLFVKKKEVNEMGEKDFLVEKCTKIEWKKVNGKRVLTFSCEPSSIQEAYEHFVKLSEGDEISIQALLEALRYGVETAGFRRKDIEIGREECRKKLAEKEDAGHVWYQFGCYLTVGQGGEKNKETKKGGKLKFIPRFGRSIRKNLSKIFFY